MYTTRNKTYVDIYHVIITSYPNPTSLDTNKTDFRISLKFIQIFGIDYQIYHNAIRQLS